LFSRSFFQLSSLLRADSFLPFRREIGLYGFDFESSTEFLLKFIIVGAQGFEAVSWLKSSRVGLRDDGQLEGEWDQNLHFWPAFADSNSDLAEDGMKAFLFFFSRILSEGVGQDTFDHAFDFFGSATLFVVY